jgi:1-acyl-sn-glycerol-3-phosphate acyltransferase
VGLLVNDLGIPVVPIRIDGLFEVKRAGKRTARPFRIKVKIGRAIQFARDAKPQEIADKLRSTIDLL